MCPGYLNDGVNLNPRYFLIKNTKDIINKLKTRNFLTYGVDAKLILLLIIMINHKVENILKRKRLFIDVYDYKYCVEQLLAHKPVLEDQTLFLQAGKILDVLSQLENNIA